ncbi:PIN domain-containing protein [Aureispira anguillae]|uniref:PIN domain-containing protein n=1 Tax=Aureispira anguillae TaxID=2864201 RepID=A0A916DWC6_9BACT|nr:hypothetical protein [Aureispira anguillae]BDS14652.1 hypothetical protein AsAng_0054330 [Aureispira anguillae]
MNIVVNDANILIDLVELELLVQFFELDFEFYTTDLVFEELHEHQQDALSSYIDNGSLIVNEFSDEELIEINLINAERPRLSQQDCSAFYQARELGATLLTSDNILRKFANENKVNVHGHLWVFDCMVSAETLSPFDASEKLDELCNDVNPRLSLPQTECENRKILWSS